MCENICQTCSFAHWYVLKVLLSHGTRAILGWATGKVICWMIMISKPALPRPKQVLNHSPPLTPTPLNLQVPPSPHPNYGK